MKYDFDNGSSQHRIVTPRAVVAVKLRWSRLMFDREAALVPVVVLLFLHDLVQNGSPRRWIVSRQAATQKTSKVG